MLQTRKFPLRVVLSVTTDRLLTERKGERDNGISDLYDLLGWMTDDQPMTHQLGRFGKECKPWLFKWFPELHRVTAYLTDLDLLLREMKPEDAVSKWLASLNDVWCCGVQDAYAIPRIPKGDHEIKSPVDELIEMRGSSDGIVVVEAPSQ
jgi:hypothetical protein